MLQDSLNLSVMNQVRTICEDQGYEVRFFLSELCFRIYANKFTKCNGSFISSTVIERVSSIEHVVFSHITCLGSVMSATFTIDDLSLCM